MKRLTEHRDNGVILVDCIKQKESAIHRLAAIEDILGDDYDLDRLRELVEADHDGRCFITGRPYPVTGKAADGKITGWVKDGFYCPICQKIHERAIKKTVYLSREAALKGEQDG